MTRTQFRTLPQSRVSIIEYRKVEGSYKFNSLACDVIKPELGYIQECAIKAVDRKRNMINIVAYLNKSITDFEIQFRMVKRESGGWHPFLYEMRVDACKFFSNRRRLFIPNLIYSALKRFTNVNHTCPYLAGTVLSLWNWSPVEAKVLEKFPVEFGQYGLQTTWYSGKMRVVEINGSVLYFK
ncbi:uncharacterized protein LOC117589686 [Drosophila guanche]|uniref:uncharacterized protein LOC117589686 n=1 Tax=Drosophila guanche TaxID=7266 RepID=UPI0014709DD5|nr:uncharacterized protein LOC117589686 [Drosophila guanche]